MNILRRVNAWFEGLSTSNFVLLFGLLLVGPALWFGDYGAAMIRAVIVGVAALARSFAYKRRAERD